MPDPSTELEELHRRVEEQSQRIDELQDALHTLSLAVQYRQEEPYLAFLAEHGIAGRRRLALNGVINGVLSRARGDIPSLGQGARTELAEDFPALDEAYLPEPIDGDINGPSIAAPSGDRWNTAVLPGRAAPIRGRYQHHGHRHPTVPQCRPLPNRRASPRRGCSIARPLASQSRPTARTARTSGVLHGGRRFVQYAQPTASTSRPSCSGSPGQGHRPNALL